MEKAETKTPRDATGTLPQWDLADLYPGPNSPALAADFAEARQAAEAFEKQYKDRLAKLDSASFGRAIADYERLDERLGRILSFAGLYHATRLLESEAGRFYQSAQEQVTDISAHTLFFTLEINRLDDAVLERLLESPAAAHYAPWIRDLRIFRPHQLSDEVEHILHDKAVAGRMAWIRLFDQTLASLRFPVSGRDLTAAEVFHLLSDGEERVRRMAAESISAVLATNIRLLAHITNTLAKDKAIEDRWRRYPASTSARNLSNRVEDDVVDALVKAVRQSYPRLSHRYYRLKAGWLGKARLEYWDRNAPLPGADDRVIPWSEACTLVGQSYTAFSPDLGALAKRFFERPWIDAAVTPGKESGAFSHPTVPSAHPYILLNYQGKARDVMTLAHELGHGVHQLLAARQGQLMADTPLTLAETASVFGEMLTFRALLGAEKDPVRRRILLANKIEDMLNTVVRQVAFYEFERRVHEERKNAELGPEKLGEIWLDVQRESLGPSINLGRGYEVYWSYIPHFVHSPFYVYAYAFGDCLVNSLYSVYREGRAGFDRLYLDMLAAGGSKRHRELLAPFGLDASDPRFWLRGLDVIGEFIDQLENT
ncbi:MAG: M3 family oligoendopeptidase [Alphaproteobacteria bacterium]